MSVSSAMQAAVSGLGANAKAVGNVSENIANANTTGFKRKFSSFLTSGAGATSGAGVRTSERQNVSLQGQITMTTSSNDLALTGDGFFVVSKNPNDPIEANYMFTRAGSFTPDDQGYLKNSAGYYLAGYPYQPDGTLGAVNYTNFSSMSTVRVNDLSKSAEPSSAADVTGNLPAQETGTGTATAPFVSTMRYYTALGASESLSFSWQADPAVANRWQATVTGDDGTTYGTVDVDFFDSGATPGAPSSFAGTPDGALAPPAGFAVNAAGDVTITINNGATPQTVVIDLGSVGGYEGMTQFAGDFTPQTFDVDGSSRTELESTEFDEDGVLWGMFDNGSRDSLWRLPVAQINNPDGLNEVDGNAYKLSRDSGDMLLTMAGQNGAGSVSSFTLESSNVDVAQEMTQLIQVQRAYSSNAKVITTSDEMLQETTNLKR